MTILSKDIWGKPTKSTGILYFAFIRVKAGGFMSTLILKRIGSTIIAGDNTAKKMLA